MGRSVMACDYTLSHYPFVWITLNSDALPVCFCCVQRGASDVPKAVYDYLHQFIQTADSMQEAVQDVCLQVVREGVIHLELRLLLTVRRPASYIPSTQPGSSLYTIHVTCHISCPGAPVILHVVQNSTS